MEGVLLGFLLGEEDRGTPEGSKLNLWQIGVYLGELKNVIFSSLYLYYFILHRPCILRSGFLFMLVKTSNTRTQI